MGRWQAWVNSQIIEYLSGKLASSRSFQRLAIKTDSIIDAMKSDGKTEGERTVVVYCILASNKLMNSQSIFWSLLKRLFL